MGRAPHGREKIGVGAVRTNRAAPEKQFAPLREVVDVSIVRVGLAETKNFAEGYEAIFGKKKEKSSESKKTKTAAKATTVKKKKKAKKK
jgi:hypothetical protein